MILSLKSNLIATLGSQLYMAIVGVAVLPLYLKYMGAEAYGLFGFFSMLQVWFTLLDLGLTPTLGRETARFRAKLLSDLDFLRIFRSLSVLFYLLAIVGGGTFLLCSNVIASHWLKAKSLGVDEVTFCVQNMAVCAALRWVSGLYRGVISGAERLVWLGTFTTLITTFRFLLVIPIMHYFGMSARSFFAYQTIITGIEVLGLGLKARALKPGISSQEKIGWSLGSVKSLFKFSFVISFTSSVWILITQVDKFILSNRLSLEEYGYFTLAILIANGILVVITPISTSLMPRLANLEAQNKHSELVKIYRLMTQFVAAFIGSICVTLIFCSKPLLWIWLGDHALVERISPLLKLYACGNGVFALTAFPYYLQYAKGDLRLHFIGHVILLIFFIPLLIYVTVFYGPIGAGFTWIGMNIIYLLGWGGVIHRRFEPGLHKRWLLNDVSKILIVLISLGIISSLVTISIQSRVMSFIYVLGFAVSALTFSSLASAEVQKKIKQFLFARKGRIQHVN